MPICKGISLPLNPEEVIKRFKGGRGERAKALAFEVLEESRALIDPGVAWEEYPVMGLKDGEAFLEGGWTLRLLVQPPSRGKVERVVALAGTIGDKIEQWVSRLFKGGEALKATIADLVGSLYVEVLMDRACECMSRYALGYGLRSSHLFSPGMPGMPLEEQPKLVEMAKGVRVGIHTTEKGMMVPEKSFCGVIILGEDVPSWDRHVFCKRCALRDSCPFRSEIIHGL